MIVQVSSAKQFVVIVGGCQYKEIFDVSPYGFIRNMTDKTGRGGGYLYMLGGGCEERQNGQRRCEKTQE